MPTVAENLLALDAVKDEIKAKIGTNLGRTIGAAVPFTEYADYILPPATWMPDPLWPSLDDIADGQIGMIVRDRDDLGVAARCAFTITATANCTVDWGDGTSDTVASTVMADHTYTLGAGTPDSKGTTTFKVRISSYGTIQRLLMASNVGLDFVKQTVQYANFKATGVTNFSYAFQYCGALQSIGALSLPLCTNFSYAFYYCSALQSIGALSLPSCTNFSSAFQYCGALQSIGALSLSSCTNFSYAFQFCGALQSIGALSLPSCTNFSSVFQFCGALQSIGALSLPLCTNFSYAFYYCSALQSIGALSDLGTSAVSVDCDVAFYRIQYRGVIDIPNAKLTKIRAYGASDRYSGITGLTFHASSLFAGTSPQIDVQYTMMDRTALVALFNLLPTLTGKTINITGAIGTASLTADDRAIATGKGWTITG